MNGGGGVGCCLLKLFPLSPSPSSASSAFRLRALRGHGLRALRPEVLDGQREELRQSAAAHGECSEREVVPRCQKSGTK